MVALHPVAAGMLLGAGALGLALFVVARWGTVAVGLWHRSRERHGRGVPVKLNIVEKGVKMSHATAYMKPGQSHLLEFPDVPYDNEGVTLIVSVPDRYRLVFRDCDVR